MKPFIQAIAIAFALTAIASCYAEPEYPAYVDDGAADLVEVSPGLEVIADWDEPIFFFGDFYWVYRGGYWYRSGWYRGGWTRVEAVPDRIRAIDHPETYAHFRPEGYVSHAPVSGGYKSHVEYHAAHPASPGVHVRPAPPPSGGFRR